MLKKHPAMFTEIFSKRDVNNIYFDTAMFEAFSDNVIGISERIKMRIRWYGDTFCRVKKPILEFKVKKASEGRKELYSLPSFLLNQDTCSNEIVDLIKKTKRLSHLAREVSLKTSPVLVNNYTRRYFLSLCGRFRITYDTNLGYYDFNKKNKERIKTQEKILEIKFNREDYKNIKDITSNFNFRMDKNSKYVNGISNLIMLPDIY
jgi:SPX domain protein involved in polyphosphate accumulation